MFGRVPVYLYFPLAAAYREKLWFGWHSSERKLHWRQYEHYEFPQRRRCFG